MNAGHNGEGTRATPGRATLKLLGEPGLDVGGTRIQLAEKAFCLAAMLACAPGMSIQRAPLRSLLWGEFNDFQASVNLRQLLSRITRTQRTAGLSLIRAEDGSVALDPQGVDIDLLAWTPAGLKAAGPPRDRERERARLASFSGELLEGLRIRDGSLEDWISIERTRLLASFTERAVAYLSNTDALTDDDLDIAERLVRFDPTQEAGYRAVIRIRGERGDIQLARRAFLDCKAALAADLRTAPGPETLAIAERYFDVLRLERSAVVGLPATARRAGDRRQAVVPGPRIALMPPLDLYANPQRQRLALSLLEDLTIGLTRYRSFKVIAAHTSIAYSAPLRPRKPQTDWCDYVLMSSVAPTDEGFVINLRLTDPTTDEVHWATQVVFKSWDLPSVYRRVAAQTVAALASAIEQAELALPVAAEDPAAYRLFLEGNRHVRSTDLREIRRARRWFREAAQRQSGFAASFAGLARTKTMEWLVRGAPDKTLLQEAHDLAGRAIEIDDRDGRGYRERGFASLYLQRHDESLVSFADAVDRNPHDADLLIDYADALAHSGQPAEGLTRFQLAMELNPAPPTVYLWTGGGILFQLRRYQEALTLLEPIRDVPEAARLMAACAAQAGDSAAARRYARRIRETFPNFSAAQVWAIVPNKDRADTEHLIDGLRNAGLT